MKVLDIQYMHSSILSIGDLYGPSAEPNLLLIKRGISLVALCCDIMTGSLISVIMDNGGRKSKSGFANTVFNILLILRFYLSKGGEC